jgi:hypothetical protein
LQIVERTREHGFAAELYRNKGQLLLRQGCPEAAEELHRKALSIAGEQEAKLWELRAAASLARLWRDQGRHAEARDLLAPVYGWFTEGFGTPDLKEAKSLLTSWGEPACATRILVALKRVGSEPTWRSRSDTDQAEWGAVSRVTLHAGPAASNLNCSPRRRSPSSNFERWNSQQPEAGTDSSTRRFCARPFAVSFAILPLCIVAAVLVARRRCHSKRCSPARSSKLKVHTGLFVSLRRASV